MARDPEIIAAAVAASFLNGVAYASAEYNIPDKTLYAYQKRYREDEDFRRRVELKKLSPEELWIKRTSKTINIALNELEKRMPIAETKTDAEILKQIKEIMQACVEIRLKVNIFYDMDGILEETTISNLKERNFN